MVVTGFPDHLLYRYNKKHGWDDEFDVTIKKSQRKSRSQERILAKLNDVPSDEEVYKQHPNA